MSNRRIALIASRFRDGGVERWMTRLAGGLIDAGRDCDLLLGEAPPTAPGRPDIPLRTPDDGEKMPQLITRYVEAGPDAPILIPFRTTDFSTVIRFARARDPSPPVFLATGAFIGDRARAAGPMSPRSWKLRWRLARDWPRADGVIAVSPEVASDWRAAGRFGADRIHAPAPPVVGPDVLDAAERPLEHAGLVDEGTPVVLGVGRLHHQKGFDRLVAAFARLARRRDARLVLLGRGEEEARLRQQAAALGVEDRVLFPGYVDNPWNWMRRAGVVVAPSRTETFGFVLVESLYVGTPFVADAEPPGPRSIQRATGHGELVATRDAGSLAGAIERSLDDPPAPEALMRSARAFDSTCSAQQYLAVLDRAQ